MATATGPVRTRPQMLDISTLDASRADVARVARSLNTPLLNGTDLDGDTEQLTRDEFAEAAPKFWEFRAETRGALTWLNDYFGGDVLEVAAPGAGASSAGRKELRANCGARVQYSPGSERVAEEAVRVLESLARNRQCAAILADFTTVISPPGKSVDQIPGLEAYPNAEGVAFSAARRIVPGVDTANGVAIAHESLQHWNLGLGHEFLHVFVDRTPGLRQRIEQLCRSHYRPAHQVDPVMDPEHFYVFMGQYYLAGLGNLIPPQAQAMSALLAETLGDARHPGKVAPPEAARMISSVARDYLR